MAINDVFTLHAQWRLTNGNLTAQNQFHFKQTSALILDTPGEDLVQAFAAEIEPLYIACVSGQWGIVNYVVKEQPSGLTVHEQTVPDHSGALSGDALPPQVSTILSYRTAHAGRSGKGRIYIPPANEASAGILGTPGSAINVSVTALVNGLLALASDIAYAGWLWGVWSEKEQMFYEAIGGTGRFRFATQRGRSR